MWYNLSMFKWLSELKFGTLLAIIFLFVYLSRYIPNTSFTNKDEWLVNLRNFKVLLPDYIVLFLSKLIPFSIFLSLILVIAIVISASRLMKLRDDIHSQLVPVAEADDSAFENIKNEKWQKVVLHINSENSSDWKLAILECDIMLGEILEKMGYHQDSIGEKLKAVEPSDFTNIEAAWEAHKIRNAVAHEGSEFVINHREAKRVIGLYELVFREFDFI